MPRHPKRTCGANRKPYSVGDTIGLHALEGRGCGNPLAGRSCLVLVKACLGARCEAKQQVKRRVQPWRGSGVIMTIRTNPLPQPNPSRVRYMGECFSIPTLSLSEAERRVYHNHAPPGRVALSSLRHDRASDSLHKFISDTAALQVDEIRRFYYALCIMY